MVDNTLCSRVYSVTTLSLIHILNGAGKSTIIKLLCRLYRPQSGRIVVNGIDLQEFSQEQLQKLFSVVFQDYNRFYLTLRENVAAGALERKEDDESVRKALRMAGIENEKLLMELDLPLGKLEEQGIELSGGQWQRIAIARAYFTDSEFVILDEPTSALDPIAENAMYENIASILTQKSCIFISHRLASAKMADRILVLSKGQIQEEGSHADVYKRQVNTCSSQNPLLIQQACTGLPIVLCDRTIDDYNFQFVGSNHRDPIFELVKHLKEQGYTLPVFFTENYFASSVRSERRNSFLDAVKLYYPEVDPNELTYVIDIHNTQNEMCIRDSTD